MKIRSKLTLAFLVCGMTPLVIATGISYFNSHKSMVKISTQGETALKDASYSQLVALRDVKKQQVETYFADRQEDMEVLLDTVGTLKQEAFDKLEAIQMIKINQVETYFEGFMLDMEIFARSKDTSDLFAALKQYHIDTDTKADGPYDVSTPEYQSIWEDYGKNIQKYYKESGVYDIYMICADHGHVMYSSAKKSDLGSNLAFGPFKDSNIAELWKKVKVNNSSAIVDFSAYAPANGAQAAFAGAPIFDNNGKMYGIMVVQFPINQIDAIIQERTGMGETGESYLVGKGSDGISAYRSDRVIKDGKVGQKKSDEHIDLALAGKSGFDVKVGSTGDVEIVRYDPIDLTGLDWCLISTVKLDEVISPTLPGEQKDYFTKFSEMYGYYDLFLIHPKGQVFYSVCHKPDYQTNIINGDYASSPLGVAVRDCLKTGDFAFGDFAPYAPSDGAPAAFIAQPVIYQGNTELVVALQLSDTAISKIMAAGSDIERTLEAYLVGPEGYMRSNSTLNPSYSIAATFEENKKIVTEGITEARNGKTGSMVVRDYMDADVKLLSAYTPVNVYGTNWALACEIDEAVALASVKEMEDTSTAATTSLVTWSLCVLIIAGIAVTVIGILIALGLSKPINRMVDMLKDIAEGEGDLTKFVDQDRKDELGEMGKWFNTFIKKIHTIISELKVSAGEVASAATEIAASSEQMAVGMDEQSSQITRVSSAIEEMSSSITDVARKSAGAASHSKDAGKEAQDGGTIVDKTVNSIELIAKQVDESASSVSSLGRKSEQISDIIEVINDIADQTNLLALNAAIEAARAGEHGRGFAVVADEVRKLAERTQQATEKVGSSITEIQQETKIAVERMEASREQVQAGVKLAKEAGNALERIVVGADVVAGGVNDIAAACEEQSTVAGEISQNIERISEVVRQSTEGAGQAAMAAAQLSNNSEQLQSLVAQFKLS